MYLRDKWVTVDARQMKLTFLWEFFENLDIKTPLVAKNE